MLKQERPISGAPKIREKLRRLHSDVHLPAISTLHAVLDRHGLVKRRRRRGGYGAQGTLLSKPHQPNDLWCADDKGEFMLADKRYCYPLAISDFASRYFLVFPGMHRFPGCLGVIGLGTRGIGGRAGLEPATNGLKDPVPIGPKYLTKILLRRLDCGKQLPTTSRKSTALLRALGDFPHNRHCPRGAVRAADS